MGLSRARESNNGRGAKLAVGAEDAVAQEALADLTEGQTGAPSMANDPQPVPVLSSPWGGSDFRRGAGGSVGPLSGTVFCDPVSPM